MTFRKCLKPGIDYNENKIDRTPLTDTYPTYMGR